MTSARFLVVASTPQYLRLWPVAETHPQRGEAWNLGTWPGQRGRHMWLNVQVSPAWPAKAQPIQSAFSFEYLWRG